MERRDSVGGNINWYSHYGEQQYGDSWRRERLPTTVLWTGEFHGLYIDHGVAKELDIIDAIHKDKLKMD